MKLRAENLIKTYKGRSVVKGISVEVNQGEIVGLLGPNGAGKTTSFYMIVGLVKPNAGNIYLDELDITNYPMYKFKMCKQNVGPKRMQMVFLLSNCRMKPKIYLFLKKENQPKKFLKTNAIIINI